MKYLYIAHRLFIGYSKYHKERYLGKPQGKMFTPCLMEK